MRNLVSAICALIALLCVFFITGCGGGGGGGGSIGDPPPSKSITLHGNVTITQDIANPVVVIYALPTYGTAGYKTVAQVKLDNTKGVHPYKLVIPAGQPYEVGYSIVLCDFQGGGSVVDVDDRRNVEMGGYRYMVLHMNAVQVYGESPVDAWCTVNEDPGSQPWDWSRLSIANRDVTKSSLDFETY